MYLLDNEVSFKCPLKDERLCLKGRISIPKDGRVVIGIDTAVLPEAPSGFAVSDAGFYFQYLNGDGKVNEFHIEIDIHSEASSLPVFIRRWYTEGPIWYHIDNAKPEGQLCIVGSCVSRDAFEGRAASLLSGYRARTSFASLPGAVDKEWASSVDLSANSSVFQRRMIRGDLTKDAIPLAIDSPGGFVEVDFIDERFDLLITPKGTFSESPELVKAHLDLAIHERIRFGSDTYLERFREGWQLFCDAMAAKTILVNKVFWATTDTTNKALAIPNAEIERANQGLTEIYEIVETTGSGIRELIYDQDLLRAGKQHKWGTAPFHYSDAFYEEQRRQLKNIMQTPSPPSDT